MFIWAYVHLIVRNKLGVTNLALVIESARTRGHAETRGCVDGWLGEPNLALMCESANILEYVYACMIVYNYT